MSEKQDQPGTEDPVAVGFKAINDLQKAGLGPLSWMGTAFWENAAEMGGEVAQFVSDRIKEDVKTQHEILHCKDVADLRRIQTEFLQRAVEQYTAETGKLAQMSRDFFGAMSKRTK